MSFSLHLYAMGLGDIKVNSYLDQTFSAQIELIDVGNIPLSAIKVSLASEEEFDRIGLERAYALSLLTFNVEKNANGKIFIKVGSTERISEPYMQLLVDLAWADGEVYRAYTILLDPPDYNLVLVKKQLRNIVKRQYESQSSPEEAGVIHKPVYSEVARAPQTSVIERTGIATYGPTMANETVWQIAQRYKTENILLQQMILAIVGKNPQSFTEGNLNGLIEGSRLQIPANNEASRVPLSLAKLEVLAHDKAWQERQTIVHALLPPYIDSTAPEANDQELSTLGYPLSVSKIPPISEPVKSTTDKGISSRLLPLASTLLSFGESGVVSGTPQTQPASRVTPQAKIKAEMDIATSAIESVREANALLIDQLRSLQADNKRLQQQLAKREQAMDELREQIRVIIARQGVGGQVSQQSLTAEQGSVWPWILFLLILGTGGGFAYWWLRVRPKPEEPTSPPVNVMIAPISPAAESKEAVESEIKEEKATPSEKIVVPKQEDEVLVNAPDIETKNVPPVEEPTLEEPKPAVLEKKDSEEEHLLEFEPASAMEEKPLPAKVKEKKAKAAEKENDDQGLEFVVEPIEPPAKEKPEPKSKQSKKTEKKVSDLEKEDEGLAFVITPIEPEKEMPPAKKSKKKVEEEIDDEGLEFVLEPEVEEESPTKKQAKNQDQEAGSKPVKSNVALDTLLGLAKAYIGMEDYEAARQSLEEVLEHGNDKQKLEAKSLLKEVGDRK